MKRVSLLLAMATTAMFCLMSCGNKTSQGKETSEKEESSIESEPVEEFHSADLSTFFLQGKVKSMTEDGKTMTFDKEGKLIEAGTGLKNDNGKPQVLYVNYDKNPDGIVAGGQGVERDEAGRILWLGGINGSACSGKDGYHFTYDKNGVVSKRWFDSGECFDMLTYEVVKTDNQGLPIKETSHVSDEEYEETCTIDYEYVSFDDHGNWTERKANIKSVMIDYGQGEEGNDKETKSTSEKTEKRTITYY